MSGESGLRAFGGGRLAGGHWVRILYLDESGIGNIERDPHLVVAGVLVHADTQWAPIAEHLKGLLVAATPKGQPVPKYLHAKDIFHGSGEFPRAHWGEDERYALLDAVALVPMKFKLPVVWGVVDRAGHAKQFPVAKTVTHLTDCYSIAAFSCFLMAEWLMRNHVGPSEVASIVLERNNEIQKRIADVYHYARDPAELADAGLLTSEAASLLPLTRIIDAPTYQDKSASSLLQVADFCAFALKRAVGQKADAKRWCAPFAPITLSWRVGKAPLLSAPALGF